jgi:hypothetical protein
MLPFAVRMAAPTEPAEKSSLNLNAPHTAFAAAINFDLASFMSFVSPNASLQLLPKAGATQARRL